jgi:polyhydroxyalkanoate synthesis regulator phasin
LSNRAELYWLCDVTVYAEVVGAGEKQMIAQRLRHRVGQVLKRVFPTPESLETESLKQELQELKEVLHTVQQSEINSLKREIESMHTDLQAADDKDLAMLRQEIDILRNEVQEDIAAIHRLEILTLTQRISLLNDFGKALPPTVPGRTKKSLKPHGYSFGIITNGKRNEKLANLITSIRNQSLPNDRYEVLIAGSVDEIRGYDQIRKFSMDQAASEGRLGAMRNVLAKAAAFNKFVSLDDDFLLHPKWAEAVEEIGGNFDIATGIIVNPDLSRYCDWVNIIENYTFLRAYHEAFDKCQYVTGGYGIYKDFIFLEHSWNDNLGFYQGEDVSFSKRLFDAGYQLKFVPKAVVMHDDENYRQKGYGVIRLKSVEQAAESLPITVRIEKLCPRTLS